MRKKQKEPGKPPPAEVSDAALVLAVRQGDKRAFVEIVTRYQALVCSVAFGILADFDAAQDAGQEAFLAAWRQFDTLREPDRLRPWLGQITRNAALAHRRRQRDHEPLDEQSPLADSAPGPDESAAREEECLLVQATLAKLPETYRLPLVLYYQDGQSVLSVAQTLGLSEDAVKQRLSRGRELLRKELSDVLERVLQGTRPSAAFTISVALAIGALAAPAVMAGTVFTAVAGSAAGGTVTTATSGSTFLQLMSTSKTLWVSAAVMTAVCVPVGYHHASGHSASVAPMVNPSSVGRDGNGPARSPNFDQSQLLKEWRQLHAQFGTNGAAMPQLFRAIQEMTDPLRRRAFRTALMAEWAQVDPLAGLQFLRGEKEGATPSQHLFQEWLERSPAAAVEGLKASGAGWEKTALENLQEIARRAPDKMAGLVHALPPPGSEWDSRLKDAFGTWAEHALSQACALAETLTGPNRQQALFGVAGAWGKTDLKGAVQWAKGLSGELDRDEIIRAAVIGRATVDAAAALDQLDLVPSGGRPNYFASTTAAKVLREATKTDFEGTVAWITAHPGRFKYEDLQGIADAVTDRLNADPTDFLEQHAASLKVLMPALSSALLNGAGAQKEQIWKWLQQQSPSDMRTGLTAQLLNAAAYQDAPLALRLAASLPAGKTGDDLIESLAQQLLNGGTRLYRLEELMAGAPERLRGPLMEKAFATLQPESFNNPQEWVKRLDQLPESARTRGTAQLASTWANLFPDEAIQWVQTLPRGEARQQALQSAASTWAEQDPTGTAQWINTLAPGPDRDAGTTSLVYALAEKSPRQAWDWMLSMGDENNRNQIAQRLAPLLHSRDPAGGQRLIDTGPFTPEIKNKLQTSLQQRPAAESPR